MNFVLLALAASLIFAVTNVIEKYLISKWVEKPLTYTCIVVIAESLLAFAVLIPLKGFHLHSLPFVIFALVAGIGYASYLWPYIAALRIEEASRVVPLFQLSPVYVLILSSIFLKETLSALHIAGFALLVGGGFLISARHLKCVLQVGRAFYLMLLASFVWAAVIVAQRFLFPKTGVWDGFLWMRMGALLSASAILMLPKTRANVALVWKQMSPQAKGILLLNEVLAVFAFVLIALALVSGPAAIVSSLGGLQPFFLLVFTIVISLLFPKILKEEISKSALTMKVMAILMMFAGLWLVY